MRGRTARCAAAAPRAGQVRRRSSAAPAPAVDPAGPARALLHAPRRSSSRTSSRVLTDRPDRSRQLAFSVSIWNEFKYQALHRQTNYYEISTERCTSRLVGETTTWRRRSIASRREVNGRRNLGAGAARSRRRPPAVAHRHRDEHSRQPIRVTYIDEFILLRYSITYCSPE